jgi:hypothetical protein
VQTAAGPHDIFAFFPGAAGDTDMQRDGDIAGIWF